MLPYLLAWEEDKKTTSQGRWVASRSWKKKWTVLQCLQKGCSPANSSYSVHNMCQGLCEIPRVQQYLYIHINILLVNTGADCGSDHEILIAKFRLILKKLGKTTRPFRYDLNQIPYDYTVEVTNRFKRLDLMNQCLMNYGWRFLTLYRRQGSRPSSWKRNARKQNGCLGRPYK